MSWFGLDASTSQLSSCSFRPQIAGDATRLPFPHATFGAVTALWVLYHLENPALAIREAYRVLRAGGLFAACTDSRGDAAELVHERPRGTFDA